ncbi:MAG TPA: hypothetical protein VMW94_08800 [Actinomycetes bacterium]|nr:hypothetical protein [Actinomycetes bacterium]
MPRRSFEDFASLDHLAHVQEGIVLAWQLRELGINSSTISDWTRTGGRWRRLLPGTYLVMPGEPTTTQQMRAALLYAGRTAVLTGVTAAAVHGLRKLPCSPCSPVHVSLDFARHRSTAGFVLVERTRRPIEPTTVAGFPVAPLPRALFDASRRIAHRPQTRALILEAIQRRLVTAEQLRDEVDAGQRRWTALLRDTLKDSTSGVQSAEEARFRDGYLAAGLPEPLWNPTLLTREGTFIARPDAYLGSVGLAIEIDSREHHAADHDWEVTLERHARLTAAGVVVIHVVPRRYRREPDVVHREILATLTHLDGRPAPDVVVVP